VVRCQPRAKKMRPYLENNTINSAGGMSQVLKSEALSSNSSPAKNKKEFEKHLY
jgi:hypothetical protein